ncbi:hypothetical protein OSB04_016763 [Centaurea solstitialis]|uniref:Phospholipid/glycerol acyltransferase domain-containing protein n=1 Tax=Centaurea solstitialis TaxID=347529 RepID=A0AA38T1L4_9ASTR|nr:hypothetical protein OSB04_016763 [Centaurea solstitialis]
MSDSHDDFDLMIDQVLLANLQAAELVGKLVTTGVLQNNGEGPSNKRPRGPNKERGREEGHDKLIADYFSNNPVYNDEDFKQRFRMTRRLFLRIVNDLEREVEYFKQHWDARGVKGFSALQKCTSAIRQLAYRSAADASDEYLRMSETTSRDCLENFCKGIIYLYMRQYLRKPTASDIQRIYAMHEQVHGLPGMLGSIDYKAPDSSFVVNGTHYNHGYYLADGIYPEWTTFVKAFRYPHDDERRIHFKERQESARKDIERTFATLQSKWHMVKRPARVWTRTKLQEIMYTCIILHNMIREDEDISDYPFDPTEVLPEDIETNISEADWARNVNLGSGTADVAAEMRGMDGMVKDCLGVEIRMEERWFEKEEDDRWKWKWKERAVCLQHRSEIVSESPSTNTVAARATFPLLCNAFAVSELKHYYPIHLLPSTVVREIYDYFYQTADPIIIGFDTAEDSVLTQMLQGVAVPIIGNVCHVFMHGLNHVQIYGGEKLQQALNRPEKIPLITVSNHIASMDDPLVIAALLPSSVLMHARNLRWTLCATDRCFRNPVTSAFFKCVKVLPVSRGEGIYQKILGVPKIGVQNIKARGSRGVARVGQLEMSETKEILDLFDHRLSLNHAWHCEGIPSASISGGFRPERDQNYIDSGMSSENTFVVFESPFSNMDSAEIKMRNLLNVQGGTTGFNVAEINCLGMDAAITKLNRGGWVHIFPEGSRSRDGGKTIGSVKRGAARLILDADDAPIVVPFVHAGMQEVMPIGATFPRIGKTLKDIWWHQQINTVALSRPLHCDEERYGALATVTILVGDPIDFKDLRESEQDNNIQTGNLYDAVSSRISDRLVKLKAQVDKLVQLQTDKPDVPLMAEEDIDTGYEEDNRYFRVGFSYRRITMDPTELMGFAARGLFMNQRMKENVQPSKAWNSFWKQSYGSISMLACAT